MSVDWEYSDLETTLGMKHVDTETEDFLFGLLNVKRTVCEDPSVDEENEAMKGITGRVVDESERHGIECDVNKRTTGYGYEIEEMEIESQGSVVDGTISKDQMAWIFNDPSKMDVEPVHGNCVHVSLSFNPGNGYGGGVYEGLKETVKDLHKEREVLHRVLKWDPVVHSPVFQPEIY